jgi:hypothetical protein
MELEQLQSLRDRVAQATGRMTGGEATDLANALHPVALPGKHPDQSNAFRYLQEALACSSIDAALAWVERVLPNSTGNTISWRQRDVGKPGWCGYWVKIVPDGERSGGACEAYAPSIALAIILAGLDALIAQAKEKTDGKA